MINDKKTHSPTPLTKLVVEGLKQAISGHKSDAEMKLRLQDLLEKMEKDSLDIRLAGHY